MAAIVASLPEKCLCGEIEEFTFRRAGNRHHLQLKQDCIQNQIYILKHFAGEHPNTIGKNIKFSSFIYRRVLFSAILTPEAKYFPVLLCVQMCWVGRGATSPSGAPERSCSTAKAGAGAQFHCVL